MCDALEGEILRHPTKPQVRALWYKRWIGENGARLCSPIVLVRYVRWVPRISHYLFLNPPIFKGKHASWYKCDAFTSSDMDAIDMVWWGHDQSEWVSELWHDPITPENRPTHSLLQRFGGMICPNSSFSICISSKNSVCATNRIVSCIPRSYRLLQNHIRIYQVF